ncbi:MAG: toll/interleukin-1 receptor domain-containing protein, partial [Lachnospiraceae bacterium]|nr:toll/interleukin-1 receptor domain-containing protein [Lachnospiraceae bacterium]
MAEVRKYDAFISYRHSELDKFVATTLQRKLEAFTLPKGVSSKTKKKRIERVFRDQDELPLSSNLSEPIHLALNNTDFLIVICTPRLPESKWCEEEISTFIKLYGREKILAVLAEGEPSESFPPLLTGEDYEETLPDGTKVTKHRSFEPLAADVRGKNNKEVKKKLDDAVLRIAASIFELNYDDLKQRHRERKIRRMFSVISSVAAAFMIFSAVCVGLMITIMNQSNMIMEQNTEIKEKSNEISQKNALINQQYEEAAKNLSVLTAD